MNISEPFILRPVATWLLMVAVLLAGALSYRLLPKASLPQVDYPTLQVTTQYPGASPEVMVRAVVAPLERQFGAMPGLSEMSSTSAPGIAVINLRFVLDLKLDVAEQSVQAAINAAAGFLPEGLPTPPTYSKVNPADAPVITLAITSSTSSLTDVQDLVETRLVQKLSQVPGVGRVAMSGGQRPAVRVSVDSEALASRGVGLEQLQAAISAGNSNRAKGSLEGYEKSYIIDANSQLQTAEQYRELIVAHVGGAPLRLGDVAAVTRAPEDTKLAAWANGKPAILISIQRQPGANVIQVADDIQRILPELSGTLPAAVDLAVLSDRTLSIRSSVRDTEFDLLFAIGLVVVVIFLFLRTFAGTLIPSLAVPISIVGTFGVMHLAGFSINNLTLMALTIATGFVVDDAIVMIENISRYIEEGKPPLEAALVGAKQIGFTIVSLTFSLLAVLIPLLFMGDVVGRLFREFAITLAVAILISAGVSLSFTPMLCGRLLRTSTTPGVRSASGAFDRLIQGYGSALDIVLARRGAALIFVAATFALTAVLAWYIPKGLFPVQDTNLIRADTEAEPQVSFQALSARQRALGEVLARDPAVRSVSSVVGIDGINMASNTGRMLIDLHPHDEGRRLAIAQVAERLNVAAAALSGIELHAQPVQDLSVDDRVSRGQYQYVLVSPDSQELPRVASLMAARLRQLPQISRVFNNLTPGGLAAFVEVDRDRAARLGVSVAALDAALYDAFGQRFVSTIYTQTNQYRVVLELQSNRDPGLAQLENLYVSGEKGRQIPLRSVAVIQERPARLAIQREQQFEAATLSFALSPGASLGEAVQSIEAARESLGLPRGVEARFEGAALAFRKALKNELFLIVAAVFTMFIVLGILYESFVHPLTILSTLPSAGLGALLALLLTGSQLTVIAMIGLVLLIGIVQKNAIMIIDFALEAQRVLGKAPHEAVRQACLLRFRPILMTTLAALFSAVPLAIGSGPGSELRRPLGIAMIGGLLLSQVLTLFTTPVVFLAFDRLSRRLGNQLVTGLGPRAQDAKEVDPA